MENWERILDDIMGTGDRTPEVYGDDNLLRMMGGSLCYDPRDLMDLRIDVHNAMAHMPADDKAILLAWLVGYTHEEIAGRLGEDRSVFTKRFAGILANFRALLT